MILNELIQELELLTSSLILHLHEKAAPEPWLPRAAPAPAAAVVKPLAVQPQKIKEEKVEKKREAKMEEKLPALHAPYMQLLSSSTGTPGEPPLDDMVEKLKAFGTPLRKEPIKTPAPPVWQQHVPELLFISFFPKESKETAFLQKVREAVQTRLQKNISLIFANQETELLAFASTGLLKQAIFCFDQKSIHLCQQTLSPLSFSEIEEQSIGPLKATKKLFSSTCYDLLLPVDFDQAQDFKASLWKALQLL